nr:ferritin-like domain-containing protein [Chitinivorax tropicus]
MVEADVPRKIEQVQALWAAWQAGQCVLDWQTEAVPMPVPGRPAKPVLVDPQQVPRRRIGTPAGKVALIHAIAHIEFNAINLALDAVYRFRGLPLDYYRDWLQVAAEEAYHFQLLNDRLAVLGAAYGDEAAHNGLWNMAIQTDHDVLVRMALVPRILEARGLDVTPGIQLRLRQHGDTVTADLLDIILRDEIGHVAIGNRWYRHVCDERGLDPVETFKRLYHEHGSPMIAASMNRSARKQAGFDEVELALLASLSIEPPPATPKALGQAGLR